MNPFWLILILMIVWVSPVAALSRSEIESEYAKSDNYEKMGRYTHAVSSLGMVFKEYPKGYAVNLRLGGLYTAAKKYGNALTHYDNAIVAVPDSLEPKLGKLSVLLAQERYADAVELGTRIVEVDYYNYYGNLRLAYALQMTKKYELADKVNLKMLGLYPTDVLYLTQYGALRYEQKDFSTAKSVLMDVLLFEPDNLTAKSILGLIKTANSTTKKK